MGNFSSTTRIHNDLVTSTDNEGNFVPKPAFNPQIFRSFRPKKYFKKILKKIQKTAKIFRNCEKVPESPLGRKLASLIFGNNFELHSHNGFRPKLGTEYPPTSRIDTAQ